MSASFIRIQNQDHWKRVHEKDAFWRHRALSCVSLPAVDRLRRGYASATTLLCWYGSCSRMSLWLLPVMAKSCTMRRENKRKVMNQFRRFLAYS